VFGVKGALIGAGLLLAAILGGLVYVRHLQHEAAVARSERDAALAQSAVNSAAGQITERVVRSEVIITQKAERSADEVRSLPGADAPLDPAFGAGLASELRRMRSPDAGAGDPGERDTAPALRGP
jgi:hypothetical protein